MICRWHTQNASHIPFLRSIWTLLCSSKCNFSISRVVPWIRICLPMQATWVWSLVWEDSTCCRAAKPVCHNYWACAPDLLKPMRLEPTLYNKRSLHTAQPNKQIKIWKKKINFFKSQLWIYSSLGHAKCSQLESTTTQELPYHSPLRFFL